MGNLANMLILLVCINFAMGTLGFTSSMPDITSHWMESDGSGSGGTQARLTGSFVGTETTNGAYSLINTFILAGIAALTIGGVLSILTGGFIVMFAVPIFVAVFILDLLLRVTGFLNDPTMPAELKVLFGAIITIMTLVIIINFTMGRDA